MFSSTLLIAVAALTSLVTAQNYSTNGPLSITVSQVPLVLRETWCNAQLHSCPEICGVPPTVNKCDPDTLDYKCICSDHATHNFSAYINTVPFFVCEQWIANCVDGHPNNLKGITACQSVKCGTKNASEASGSGASPSESGSASAPASSSKSGGSANTSTSKALAAATHIAQNYGTQILAGGMLAAFGLAL